MSKPVISKEELGAYRLWELDSFDERPQSPPEVEEEEPPPLAWPTAGELEEIQRQAHDEGYAAGRDEGYAAGRTEGLAAGREEGLAAGRDEGYQAGYPVGYGEGREKSLAEWERIKLLKTALDEALEQFDQYLSEDMLDLALALARQIMRSALKFRPEAVLPVIREALNSLPQPVQHPQLVLHPEDAALARTLMEEELAHAHCRIVEDNHIARGGCRIKTDASELDATLQERWDRALTALGRDDKWLD
ncbi:MAG: flagellar assembly protein FliH [Sulfuricellaceae bacterium]